ERGRRGSKQLRPVWIAGEQVGVPPDVAGLQRLPFGVRHRRQHGARPRKDGLGDKIAAKGKRGHGNVLRFGGAGAYFSGKCLTRVNTSLAKSSEIDAAGKPSDNGRIQL